MISLFRLNCRSFCILQQQYYSYCYFRRTSTVIAFQPTRERISQRASEGLGSNFYQFSSSLYETMLTHRLSAATAKKPCDLFYSPSRFENLSLTSSQISSETHSKLPLTSSATNGIIFGVEKVPFVDSVTPPLVRASFLLRDSSNSADSVNNGFDVSFSIKSFRFNHFIEIPDLFVDFMVQIFTWVLS